MANFPVGAPGGFQLWSPASDKISFQNFITSLLTCQCTLSLVGRCVRTFSSWPMSVGLTRS